MITSETIKEKDCGGTGSAIYVNCFDFSNITNLCGASIVKLRDLHVQNHNFTTKIPT